MGSGQSAQVQDHLRRWEAALQELEQVTGNNRRLMEQDRIYGSYNGSSSVSAGGGAAETRAPDKEEDPSERGVRRPSSLVSFNHAAATQAVVTSGVEGIIGASTGSLPAATTAGAGGRPRSIQTSPESRQVEPRATTGFGFAAGPAGVPPMAGGATGTDAGIVRSTGSAAGQPQRHGRQQTLEIKKAHMSLFKSYEAEKPEDAADLMQCSHFGALAVALSYLLGGDRTCTDRRKKVTVEDIFFAAQVPLHFLHTGPPHLPVMSDIVREFLDVDNRFRDDYSLETLHLDVLPTVGQVDLGPNEVGDRQTRVQLPEFRRVITQECEEETQVIRIVNYDPYVLEQEMLVDAYEDEDELNSPLATSVVGLQQHQQRHCTKNNNGAYAVIVDVRNAVQLMVTIAEGLVGDSLHVKLTEVPAASLFKAMMCAEEGHRARGFIRIFRKDSVPELTSGEIKQMWTPELCSGKVLGTIQHGTHASVVSHHISPHIVGVAWAMHLLAGVREGTHGYGNGLPVSDIIRTMKFPAEVFLDGDLSLEQVHEYAVAYMKHSGRRHVAHLYPVLTKISREDAVPTISVFDLESILLDVRGANKDPESPEHVMLLQYNASVAHNVLYVVDQLQWCVLCGYDQETQTVMLLDAHPKTFSRTWSCPLDRLHKAVTGSGYIVFSKTSATARGGVSCDAAAAAPAPANGQESCVGAPRRLAPVVQSRLHLLQQQQAWGSVWGTNPSSKGKHNTNPSDANGTASSCEAKHELTFPSLPLMPTMIAMSCTKLGSPTTFEDVTHTLPFEISTLIIRLFTLESLHVCLTEYLHFSGKDKEIAVKVYHGDVDDEGKPRLTLDTLTALVETAAHGNPAGTALIVDFHPPMLPVKGAAGPFGCLAMVLDYDKEGGHVRLADCNPNSYLRTWSVPIETLYNAVLDTADTMKHRTRGCLMLTRIDSSTGAAHEVMPLQYRRAFRLELLPVQNVFHVSPSPHFQAMSFAFSQLGCFYSPEEIFYEAYLKTMNYQRRRGSQAFAWRDVDVSLSVINRRIDAAFMAQVCKMFLNSRASGKTGGDRPAGATSPGNAAELPTTPGQPERHVSVELVEDVDVGDELDELLRTATSSADSVLLLNYDVTRASHIPSSGRSVALVRGYDPERRLVELWEAEYTVFGLAFTVTVEEFIDMGDLDADGRSPYGLVHFAWRTNAPAPKRRSLMTAPKSAEEEAEQEAAIVASSRRRHIQQATFVHGENGQPGDEASAHE